MLVILAEGANTAQVAVPAKTALLSNVNCNVMEVRVLVATVLEMTGALLLRVGAPIKEQNN